MLFILLDKLIVMQLSQNKVPYGLPLNSFLSSVVIELTFLEKLFVKTLYYTDHHHVSYLQIKEEEKKRFSHVSELLIHEEVRPNRRWCNTETCP